MKEYTYRGVKIQIVKADITKESTDAIVNAANSYLKHGGGVAWAIVRAGGGAIQKESDEYVRTHGPVPTGNVVVTGAGRLKAKYVIHAVGPVWRNAGNERQLLFKAVYNSLLKASELELKSISFPAISTGIYGYPKNEAARVFGEAIKKFIDENHNTTLELIRICLYDNETLKIFEKECRIN